MTFGSVFNVHVYYTMFVPDKLFRGQSIIFFMFKKSSRDINRIKLNVSVMKSDCSVMISAAMKRINTFDHL